MQKLTKLLLLVLLVFGALAQKKLIMTSDQSVEVTEDGEKPKSSGFADGPSRDDQGQGQGQGSGGSGGSLGGGLGTRPGMTSIFSSGGGSFGSGSPSPIMGPPQNIRQSSAPSPSGARFAKISQPNQEAMAMKSKMASSSALMAQTAKPSAEAQRIQSSLSSAKWIAPGWPIKKVVYWTPCFHNSCPGSPYIIDIRATCDFTIYLTDEYGNIISTIGSGYAWWDYSFSFSTGCKNYRVKIVLDCICTCGTACFNIWQDQTDCFNCPDSIMHTYNPNTCKCECASSCQDCRNPQKWYDFPKCTCGCPFVKSCSEGKYWDAKTCSCKCLPSCCPLPTPCGCI